MKMTILLFLFVSVSNFVQAESHRDQKILAIDAIKNVIPTGDYKSRNAFEFLKRAETKTDLDYASVVIIKSTGLFQGIDASCEFYKSSEDVVLFERDGKNFHVRVYNYPKSPTTDEPSCEVKYKRGTLYVSDWNRKLSLSFLCQSYSYYNGSEVGRIPWDERNLANDPRPLCFGVN